MHTLQVGGIHPVLTLSSPLGSLPGRSAPLGGPQRADVAARLLPSHGDSVDADAPSHQCQQNLRVSCERCIPRWTVRTRTQRGAETLVDRSCARGIRGRRRVLGVEAEHGKNVFRPRPATGRALRHAGCGEADGGEGNEGRSYASSVQAKDGAAPAYSLHQQPPRNHYMHLGMCLYSIISLDICAETGASQRRAARCLSRCFFDHRLTSA